MPAACHLFGCADLLRTSDQYATSTAGPPPPPSVADAVRAWIRRRGLSLCCRRLDVVDGSIGMGRGCHQPNGSLADGCSRRLPPALPHLPLELVHLPAEPKRRCAGRLAMVASSLQCGAETALLAKAFDTLRQRSLARLCGVRDAQKRDSSQRAARLAAGVPKSEVSGQIFSRTAPRSPSPPRLRPPARRCSRPSRRRPAASRSTSPARRWRASCTAPGEMMIQMMIEMMITLVHPACQPAFACHLFAPSCVAIPCMPSLCPVVCCYPGEKRTTCRQPKR